MSTQHLKHLFMIKVLFITLFYNKNAQQTRNGREFPQGNKGHLQENLQQISGLLMKTNRFPLRLTLH